jgi:hypothetical protein
MRFAGCRRRPVFLVVWFVFVLASPTRKRLCVVMASITKLAILIAVVALVVHYVILFQSLNMFAKVPANHNTFKRCRNIASDSNALPIEFYTGAILLTLSFM